LFYCSIFISSNPAFTVIINHRTAFPHHRIVIPPVNPEDDDRLDRGISNGLHSASLIGVVAFTVIVNHFSFSSPFFYLDVKETKGQG
jgi:hypothetical protein